MGKAITRPCAARGVRRRWSYYPNESHGIRQPRHREDVLRRLLEWLRGMSP